MMLGATRTVLDPLRVGQVPHLNLTKTVCCGAACAACPGVLFSRVQPENVFSFTRRARLEALLTSSPCDLCVLPIRRQSFSQEVI